MFLKVFKKYFALFISKKVPADISQKDEGDTVSLEYIQNIHDNIQNMIKFGEAKYNGLVFSDSPIRWILDSYEK